VRASPLLLCGLLAACPLQAQQTSPGDTFGGNCGSGSAAGEDLGTARSASNGFASSPESCDAGRVPRNDQRATRSPPSTDSRRKQGASSARSRRISATGVVSSA
jgi:hypothetical protein